MKPILRWTVSAECDKAKRVHLLSCGNVPLLGIYELKEDDITRMGKKFSIVGCFEILKIPSCIANVEKPKSLKGIKREAEDYATTVLNQFEFE